MPKVSVVVPVYKVEKYLDRTMQSLLDQTLKDIEIVLVDDGSPDNCPVLCDGYANKYTNVRVLHKKNAGLGMACNSGLEIATGEYIAFCDSDDYVDKDMYEAMYNAAVTYHADAVFTGIKTVNDKGTIRPMNGFTSLQIMTGKDQIHSFIMDMIASEPSDPVERHIAMSAKVVLYRRNLIEQHHLRFVSERQLISEDLIWNMDFLCHTNCAVALPQTFYYYYNNTTSLTKQIRTDRFEHYKMLKMALYHRAKCAEMPKETQIRIDRMFIGYSRCCISDIYNSPLPLKEKKEKVKAICKDHIWDCIRNSYPTSKMPMTHHLLFLLMKYNCYAGMALIYKIKNNISNRRLMFTKQ